jgi:hypothetical protein
MLLLIGFVLSSVQRLNGALPVHARARKWPGRPPNNVDDLAESLKSGQTVVFEAEMELFSTLLHDRFSMASCHQGNSAGIHENLFFST